MADDKSGKPPPLMGATAIRPPDRVGMDRYTHILYDPKDGTILTRTPKSWALIMLFYCIYYTCLAAFWLACMKIFLHIQIQVPSYENQNAKPTWTLDESIIRTNPGIGVRPSQAAEQIDSGIFTLDTDFKWDGGSNEEKIKEAIANEGDLTKTKGSKGYAYRAFNFFEVYRINSEKSSDDYNCEVDKDGYHKSDGKFCRFDRGQLGDCENFPYGYGNGDGKFMPCVFLKLNRIMDLKPEPLSDSNIGDQDDSIRQGSDAKKFLEELKEANYPKKVLIHCEGAYPGDKEVLNGKMRVFPEAAGLTNTAEISLGYFPYDKYRRSCTVGEAGPDCKEWKGINENALIAIQFKGLKNFQDRLIHVICKAYYAGVVHSKKDKAGLVKFEMYLNGSA